MRTMPNFIPHVLLGGAALGLIAVTGPAAFAASHGADDPKAPPPHMEVQTSADGVIKYCAQIGTTTGTILPHKVCKTAAEWEKEGIHIARK